jgi:subtilisin family serine protease
MLDAMAESDGSGVRVAVVDTGIEHDHPWVGGKLAASYVVETAPGVSDTGSGGGRAEVRPTEPMDVCGHGTAAAGQIRRIAPGSELLSIRVLSASREGSSEALVEALRWLSTQEVGVVNMSLSTLRLALALRIGQAVDDLYARNVCCVCAKGYQQDGRDYPTSFASTVGVTYAQLRTAELRPRKNDLVQFEASGVGNTVAWQHGSTRRVTGSSYATPLVTGLLARWLQLDPALTPYQLKTLLHAYAQRQADGWWQPWMDAAERTPA